MASLIAAQDADLLFRVFVLERRRKPALHVKSVDFCFVGITIWYSREREHRGRCRRSAPSIERVRQRAPLEVGLPTPYVRPPARPPPGRGHEHMARRELPWGTSPNLMACRMDWPFATSSFNTKSWSNSVYLPTYPERDNPCQAHTLWSEQSPRAGPRGGGGFQGCMSHEGKGKKCVRYARCVCVCGR